MVSQGSWVHPVHGDDSHGIARDSLLACQEAEDTVLKIRPACFFGASGYIALPSCSLQG